MLKETSERLEGAKSVERIRVMLAEDIAILRKALMSLLAPYPDVVIAGEASDGLEAVRLVGELTPQVVLMDLSMPRMDGVEAIAEIKRQHPEIKVIALTAHGDPELVGKTLLAGADGYMLKNASADELVSAIRSVAAGRQYISLEVSSLLVGQPGMCSG
jgi:DNA-binding NarL/FixJ family response regulator